MIRVYNYKEDGTRDEILDVREMVENNQNEKDINLIVGQLYSFVKGFMPYAVEVDCEIRLHKNEEKGITTITLVRPVLAESQNEVDLYRIRFLGIYKNKFRYFGMYAEAACECFYQLYEGFAPVAGAFFREKGIASEWETLHYYQNNMNQLCTPIENEKGVMVNRIGEELYGPNGAIEKYKNDLDAYSKNNI